MVWGLKRYGTFIYNVQRKIRQSWIISIRKNEVVRFDDDNEFLDDFLNVEGTIEVSAVESESTFSTYGRVFDEERTCLTTLIVELLVFIKDWERKLKKSIIYNIEDILKDDDMALDNYFHFS